MECMNKEIAYSKLMSDSHIRKFGQYFTSRKIADFMSAWVCHNAKTLLDPAVGNSIFFKESRKYNKDCELVGYEIDKNILKYFGNPLSASIINDNYLFHGWGTCYDAIICNPPYGRFQYVENKNKIIDLIYKETGIKCSGYTNLYILFLVKSIFQMTEGGRLAYIIPSEFMSSGYGQFIKKLLTERRIIKAIINFNKDNGIFFNATTTSCILMLENNINDHVYIYNLSSEEELTGLIIGEDHKTLSVVDYDYLVKVDKWRSCINQELPCAYSNLKSVSDFCTVSRGIATGANDFFCFSRSKALQYKIPNQYLKRCICHSSDIKYPIFQEKNFQELLDNDKVIYLFDAESQDSSICNYINYGMRLGINKKYLPSRRTPWYSMERKKIPPIFVTSASRNKIKFVRNLAEVVSLTTFHSIFIKEEYQELTDLIFCYFLTPIAQNILRENRKILGNGLDKFQPSDLNNAQMLDISLISKHDKDAVFDIYKSMLCGFDDTQIDQLNKIFSTYLV